ncbi:hypothetical protein CEP52_006831 [Fusarium oligoseptatum]|uniref:Nephrocystin 3-like N-terminal domain-containing protein n=1 Tax=Fusarium oligoseptatum TaxID=2604345 RepID=A0A428TQZ1_9HYPO|nr:hypothetical protein CEP52_006831 [Fusarium oligoseptatum]
MQRTHQALAMVELIARILKNSQSRKRGSVIYISSFLGRKWVSKAKTILQVLEFCKSLSGLEFPRRRYETTDRKPPLSMDPLSITTAVVASLQVASSILSHCYSVRTEMRKIPGTLIQIIDEVRTLRNLMETVESILDKNEISDQPGTSEQRGDSIKPVIATCLSELQAVERRIRPQDIEELLGSRRKAFLQTLTWRLKGDEAKESILSLQRCKASLNLAISSHNSLRIQNVERLSISLSNKMDKSLGRLDDLSRDIGTAQLNDQQKAILDWLSPLKPAHDHVLAQSSHQPAGSGKTVMMSHIIESTACHAPVDEAEPVCAFVYCNFRNPDTQDPVKIMGALLGQMCTQTRCFHNELQSSFRTSTEQGWGQQPTIDMISKTIKVLSTKRRTYLFIDGMDEVGDTKALVEILVSLSDSSCWLNILMSSRNDVALQKTLSDVCRVSLEHHVPEIDQDIERFQWAACQLDSLSHCRTIRGIKKSLETLPQGLSETYAKLLVQCSPTDVVLVRKIMTWLAFSSVPLTLHQLWEALAIEKGQKVIDGENRLRSPQDILLLGSSLLSASSDGHVALSHLSVRDYLVSSEIRNNPATAPYALDPSMSHKELAQDCLTYLLLSNLSAGPSDTEEEYLSRLEQFPLLQYATKYWFYHARKAAADDELRSLTMNLFAPDARDNFMSWVQVLNADSPFKWNVFPRHATPIYYAASLGLDEAVESLLALTWGEEINAPGSRFGGTPIHAAAIRGHVTIIKKLIAAGADPGKADFNKVTPLHSAASRRRMETIRVLLEHGASREAKDGMDGKTPADWARLNFYEKRSGLDCSRIVGITVGEESCTFDNDFTSEEQDGGSAQ